MKPPEIMGKAQAEWVFRHGHRRCIRLTINVRCLREQISADRFLKCPYHGTNDHWLLKWWMCSTWNDILNGSIVKHYSVHICHDITLTVHILKSLGIWYGQKYADVQVLCTFALGMFFMFFKTFLRLYFRLVVHSLGLKTPKAISASYNYIYFLGGTFAFFLERYCIVWPL